MECCRYCTTATGRHIGCHGSCESYIREKEEHAVEAQRVAKERNKANIMASYITDDSRNSKRKKLKRRM